ncbi:hypothetical protein BH09BAC3_BH09BAC3_33580 [soil metagenome]
MHSLRTLHLALVLDALKFQRVAFRDSFARGVNGGRQDTFIAWTTIDTNLLNQFAAYLVIYTLDYENFIHHIGHDHRDVGI